MDKKQRPHRQKPIVNKNRAGAKNPSGSVAGKFIRYPAPRLNRNTTLQKQAEAQKSRKDIRKQKNRSRFITLILVVTLLAICLYISLKVLFIVRKVEMTGSERYTQEEIVNFCAIPMELPIFEVETKEIARALPQNFTYVESAKLIRRLPDKIQVQITDSIPTYYSENKEGELSTYTIYSQGFKQLTVQAARPVGLMGISRDLENRRHRESLLEFIELLNKKGYGDVTCIYIGTAGDISFDYQNRVRVNLGTMLDMEYKLKMSFHILNKELTAEEKGVIDSTTSGSSVFKPSLD